MELLVTFVLLAYASEMYSHRSFTTDPRSRFIVLCFAVFIGTLGIFPILFHVSPRLGRLGLLIWLASLLLFGILGAVTKP